jgi:hypothetical protein
LYSGAFNLPLCSSCDSLDFTGKLASFSVFYREKTKKICQKYKCHHPMNPSMLHQTDECQDCATPVYLREGTNIENVVKTTLKDTGRFFF